MNILSRIVDSFKYLDISGVRKIASLTERMFRFKTMPEASWRWEGKLVQYIGPTNATFHRGYFYTCVDNADTYEWQRTDTQPNGDLVIWDGTHAQYDVEQDGIPIDAYLNFTDDYDNNVEVGVYSTREICTGKLWIDKKPIYRKVLTLDITTSGGRNIAAADLHIEQLTMLRGIFNDTQYNYMFPVPDYSGDSAKFSLSYAAGNKIIHFESNGTMYGAKGQLFVIVEYTKTAE